MHEPLWTADTGRTALKPYLFNWFAKFQPLFQFQGCCLFLLSNIYVPCALCLSVTSSLEPEVCISQLQHIRRTTLRIFVGWGQGGGNEDGGGMGENTAL